MVVCLCLVCVCVCALSEDMLALHLIDKQLWGEESHSEEVDVHIFASRKQAQ